MRIYRTSQNSMSLFGMLATILMAVLLSGLGATANAVLIDFEAYFDGQNLHGVNLGGVTLTNPTNGIVEIYDDRFGAGYHSPTKAISSVSGCESVNPIVGVFDSPQTYIALWGGDSGGDTDSWELEAFDAPIGGTSLGLAQSGGWNGLPFRKLAISAPNIWRFEARWTGAECGVGYDDLEFIPEPGTVLLLGLGSLTLVRRRRK